MTSMFNNSAFNQNISSWDVSTVTRMQFMFSNATVFNQDLTGWSVNPNVTACNSFKNNAAWTQIPAFSNCTP